MRDKRNNRGMTMGELLVVIGIISILAGVAFVAVVHYQRSMAQLERDGIAKEIFVAAQNHLTTAEGGEYLGLTNLGEASGIEGESDKGIFYYVVNNGSAKSDATDIFNLMLPFGSIDDTVRTLGSYIIRYHKDTGKVLDVFYCSTNASPDKFNHIFTEADHKKDLLDYKGVDKKSKRRNFKLNEGEDAVLGWYGAEAAGDINTVTLEAPSIEIVNKERLSVIIWDKNIDPAVVSHASLRLIITGCTSGQQHYVDVTSNVTSIRPGEYEVILDDITNEDNATNKSKWHFAYRYFDDKDGQNGNDIIPGENITVQAISYSTTAYANIAYSVTKTTNSLFADADSVNPKNPSDTTTTIKTAYINNIRHLENLHQGISNLGSKTEGVPDGNPPLNITNAVQTSDLIWSDDDNTTKDFLSEIRSQKKLQTGDQLNIYMYNSSTHTGDGDYMPVNININDFYYDGGFHSIKGIKVNNQGASGMIGTMGSGTIKNLRLIDSEITAMGESGYAGALAGNLSGTTVTNVVAYNSGTQRDADIKSTSAGDNVGVGGLIGTVKGGNINYCGAALSVQGSKAAGGMIGNVAPDSDSYKINGCYSGGHTDKGEYYSHNESGERTGEIFNITAKDDNTGVAGGLVGDASKAEIYNSYSTCSVSGKTAGGFVGKADNTGKIINCYCTGLVSPVEAIEQTNSSGQKENVAAPNAFIGGGSPTFSDDKYYEIINEVSIKEQGKVKSIEYKKPCTQETSSITALDESATSFNNFDGNYILSGENIRYNTGQRQNAVPYDEDLLKYYNGKYNLKTVCQLWEANKTDLSAPEERCFAGTHYGDWPAPELFIINKGTAPAQASTQTND